MTDDILAHHSELALPDDIQKALRQLRETLQEIYLSRLQGIYLYGSYARGEGDEEASDVDVLVVLRGEVAPGREIGRLNALVSEIALEHNLLISVYPISEEWFENRRSPFLVNARQEAIAL